MELEEERRLCYVGMTRAMDALVMTRARYRRRYGNDMPESSIPSRFLEEIPPHLLEDLTRGQRPSSGAYGRALWFRPWRRRMGIAPALQLRRRGPASAPFPERAAWQSAGGGARFFGQHRPVLLLAEGEREPAEAGDPGPAGATGFRSGQRVRHPKYGEGVVFRREGDGDDAKITVQFAEFGVKKLVEKFAQLEKV
jgi:DNA helicase-2/ATP-dependent DNA helicase PcrA